MVPRPVTEALLDLPTARVGPLRFRVAPLTEAVARIVAAGSHGEELSRGTAVHFANAYTIALADVDPDYRELLTRPDSIVFTDGMPVAWFGRRAHPDLATSWERVYGPDAMSGVLDHSDESGPRHYLLGGSPDTLERLRAAVASCWPAAKIVGAESPPYRPLTRREQDQQDARIVASGATLVWVGLGTPKQDWEVARLAAALPVVALAVGAAFDFLGGTKPQAPVWMQRSGTEWLYRLASEPRRLFKRYLWGNPRFVYAAWRDRRID